MRQWDKIVQNEITNTRKKMRRALFRKNAVLSWDRPVVSFTFDDFPHSAFKTGGAILKDFGVRGTYFVSIGLIDRTNECGRLFSIQDLCDLIADGHELACHTYSHIGSLSTNSRKFKLDVVRNSQELSRLLSSQNLDNFSYPHGEVTIWAKRYLKRIFLSCRGIEGGINIGKVDLNLLLANRLYSAGGDINSIKELIAKNAEMKGWLIFYTHDVASLPSSWGCTPEYFAETLKEAIRSGADVLSIREAIGKLGLS